VPRSPDILFLLVLVTSLVATLLSTALLQHRRWAGGKLEHGLRPADVFPAVALVSCNAVMSYLGLSVEPKTPPEASWGAALNLLVGQLVVYGGVVGLGIAWLDVYRQQKVGQLFGLRALSVPRVVQLACVYLVPAYVLAMLFRWLSQEWMTHFRLPTPLQDAVFILQGRDGLPMQVAVWIAAVVLAPLTEELLFRGMLFGSLRTILPVPAAMLLSGMLFGAVHFNSAAFLSLTVLGVAFAWAYHHTRCLWVSITMHVLFNLSQSVHAVWFS
jgi:membrane protease YdiL (CAAX protease family)